ncbi:MULTISPECIES: hypothetical protein [unclassified Leucobacter]|uniref:hypothetical protein n=1 Tax=unclassified Leucobacter TaxID=2621730 RepID=UPI00165EB535|nr:MULTISPECIES: hypothetical protein [unclassified Leucobacter]MBC9927152.1 hypothetical protein [Leucobacter sp. cx-169]
MTITPTTPLPQGSHAVAALAFIEEIRRQCADLPAEEIDELTDGLGADLVDRLCEGADLGDPAEYAAELRAAAGLPPKGNEKKRASLRDAWSAAQRWWVATPRRRGVADFMVTLTPVWWVARGLMVGLVFTVLFRGLGLLTLLLTAAAVVISVQWGRGRWQPNGFIVFLRRASSVGAVIALVPASFMMLGSWFAIGGQAEASEPWVQPGLVADGVPVENVFAYDCAGNPIDGVQLFDAEGQPLNADENMSTWDEVAQQDFPMVPNALASRPDAWNVFPLAEQGRFGPTKPPFAKASALSHDCLVDQPEAEVAAKGATAGAGAEGQPEATPEAE